MRTLGYCEGDEHNVLFALNRRVMKACLVKQSLDPPWMWSYTFEGAMLRYFENRIDRLRWQRLKPMESLPWMLVVQCR